MPGAKKGLVVLQMTEYALLQRILDGVFLAPDIYTLTVMPVPYTNNGEDGYTTST